MPTSLYLNHFILNTNNLYYSLLHLSFIPDFHLPTPPSMAGSSSFPSSSSRRWDVFLSFRGEDIRKTFIDHLYTALDQAGIQTFKDDPELRKGEEISPALLNAIQDSKFSIPVFSKNYASSRWCLDELVKILECKRTNGQILHPVFYDVDPSVVRNQRGTFAEAIEKHKLHSMDKVKIWRDALTEASNLAGHHLENDANGHESNLIQQIVKDVLQEVNPKAVIVAEHLVAMDSRVKDIYEKISIGSSNVRVIGIYGMGGVGKTTVAKAFYNKYFHHFERSCFLENVREASQGYNGPLSLVKQLISELMGTRDFKVDNVERGVNFLKERVRTKKVLIVLDDLDQSSQSKLLVRYWNFFGPESRIIITTRDTHLLDEFKKINGYMVMTYMVKTLDKYESLKLLSYHAFRGTISEDFTEILERIVSYTRGLPLALEVLGSFLFRRTKVEWTSTLEKLQQFPNNQIQTILKISYDALDHNEKEIFLDIACCLLGMDKEEADHIFVSSGFHPGIGIKLLEERCLLTIDWENKFKMHDLIREMGREIVREESIKKPGKLSRLWHQEEVCDVLKKQKPLKSLKILNASHSPSLTTTPDFGEVKMLEKLFLSDCPSLVRVHPSVGVLGKLVRLDLSECSNLERLPVELGNMEGLQRLDASNTAIKQLPDSIGHMARLVQLDLSGCSSLRSLPSSICNLSSLEQLYLDDCVKLVGLPVELGNMKSLRRLVASNTAIEQLPDSVGHLSRLVTLGLSNCENLRNLPNSICNLSSLEELWMRGCLNLKNLPEPLGNLKLLFDLDISVGSIDQLPGSVGLLKNLGELSIEECNMRGGVLPDEIGSLSSQSFVGESFCSQPANLSQLVNLTHLCLINCKSLQSLSKLPLNLTYLFVIGCTSIKLPNLSSLKYLRDLVLNNCSSLESLPDLPPALRYLDLRNCRNLRNTIKESLLQGLLDRRDSNYEIKFPCGAIPDWFSHQRIGSSVSFDMPPNLMNNFIGMVLWAVYSSNENANTFIDAIISNKTDGTDEHCDIGYYFSATCEVHSWVRYIGKPISMKSQDRIEVVFRGGINIKVERCGVHLLHNNTSTQMGRKRGRDMDVSETSSHVKRLKLWISDVSETISHLKRLKL